MINLARIFEDENELSVAFRSGTGNRYLVDYEYEDEPFSGETLWLIDPSTYDVIKVFHIKPEYVIDTLDDIINLATPYIEEYEKEKQL